MRQTISIDELKPGMFLQALGKQKKGSHHSIKKPGLVPNEQVIELLRKKGVLEVIIERPDTPEPVASSAERPDTQSSAESQGTEPCSFEQEMERAEKLYAEARWLQKKALSNIAEGMPVDVKPMEKMADSFIDSVFRNGDALTALTQIRQKDAYLLEHSINVSILMAIFCKYLQIPRKVMQQLCLGALMHDLGKIKIPEEVLHKPGKLTDDEFELMKKHVIFSRDVLDESGAELGPLVHEVVIQHHEKLNGKGYPYGLPADKISQYGRMVSIVDIYDALTADRCYKRGMMPNAALGILQGLTPDQLDAELVAKFIRCMSLYPVGTLVKLESERLGIVVQANEKEILKPKVKVFYSTKHKHHINVEIIDLAQPECNDKIASCEKPEKHNLDITKYF